jgi:hypothetical protein
MWSFGVPNVPCGVERCGQFLVMNFNKIVPNVPCGGVESIFRMFNFVTSCYNLFLMYRVELKGL